MNERHTNRLIDDFPSLYRDCFCSPHQSNMAFGFECGDGWFDIIYKLSEQLEEEGVFATQVKEKYGTLRFYVGYASDRAFDMIDEAEAQTETTCELCGERGRLRGRGWVVTRCDKCYEEENHAT